jgi:hypothetical protein
MLDNGIIAKTKAEAKKKSNSYIKLYDPYEIESLDTNHPLSIDT